VGIRTSSEFGNAEISESSYANVRNILGKFDGMIVPVVTGFLGQDEKGRITTLGRGGSDLTATVLGAGVPVDEVQVWKDVDGIMTADPRLVKGALPVNHVTYEEAAELAYFGAEVLHPISMQPAIRSNIPVRVKNSYNPSSQGTIISATRDTSAVLVTAIVSYALAVATAPDGAAAAAGAGDRSWLVAGTLFLESIENNARTSCGYAAVADVSSMELDDVMPSFFLSETCKYLYLLFDEGNFVHSRDYIFSTEAHLFDPKQVCLKPSVSSDFLANLD
jgi:hypothetical protein